MLLFYAFIALFLGLNLIGKIWLIVIISFILSFLLCVKRYKKKGLILFASFFTFGVLFSQVSIKNTNTSYLTYKGVVVDTSDNYYIFYSKFERFYVYEKSNSKEKGDVLKLTAKLSDIDENRIESEFNFHDYLENKGISKKLTVKDESSLFRNPIKKKKIKNSFLSNFNEDGKVIVNALMFNTKDYNNESIKLIDNLNLIFLFSTSGIFIHLIFKIIEYLLELKLSSLKARIITVCILFPYLIFAIDKIGILRVLLIYIFKIINEKFLKNKYDHIEIISLIGVSLLIFNKYFAYQSSFYIGFFISYFMYFSKNAFKCKGKIKQRFFSTICMFIFTLPLSVSSDNSLHIFQLLFQFIFIPINSLTFLIGLICFYKVPIYFLINFDASLINRILLFIKQFDINIASNYNQIGYLLLHYSIFILFTYLKEIKFNKLAKLSLISLSSLFVISTLPTNLLFYSSVSFINVGQGDCALIQDGFHNYLIDTGGSVTDDIAANCLIPFLNKKRIRKIDSVFISHYDNDHSGALSSLKQNFKVQNTYDFSNNYPIKKQNINFVNLNNNTHDNDNDNSVVLYFTFLNKSWLFMGDASISIEKEIILNNPELDCDILKVGHHGSSTSTSSEFLKLITPNEAIISVGKNYYGHPANDVLNRLKNNNVKIRRTDLEGTITYKSFCFNV